MFFFFLCVSPAYAFKIGDYDIANTINVFNNDKDSPSRLVWIGSWRYKHVLFFKPIYRADYSQHFNDTPFSIFTPDVGVYFYKDLALRFQYEARRYHTARKTWTDDDVRAGLSYDKQGFILGKRLLWYNDVQYFPYETMGEERWRDVLKLKYGKWCLNTINYIDLHVRDYMNISTLGYSIYKNKDVDVSLKFEWQKQKAKEQVFRAGMGVDF
jgi:hypothetical protein